MYTLYDFQPSGNGYKSRLLLNLLRRPFRYVEVDILKGESRTPEFLRLNANGRIPVLQLDDGQALCESNAIIYYLAQDSDYFPTDRLDQARVMQWLFFEQYSHEPNIATSRFIRQHRTIDADVEVVLAQKKLLGEAALKVMDEHLSERDWFVGTQLSIADIALYAYTHVADEGGFDLAPYPALNRWLARVAATPGYVPISDTSGRS